MHYEDSNFEAPTVPRVLSFPVPTTTGGTTTTPRSHTHMEMSFGKGIVLFGRDNSGEGCRTPRQGDALPRGIDLSYGFSPAVPPTPKKPFTPAAKAKRPRIGSDEKALGRQLTQVLKVFDSDNDGSQETAPQAPAALTVYSQNTTQGDNLSQSQAMSQQQTPNALHGYHQDFMELELLGTGSFGRVHAVERRFDAQRFAVKHVVESFGGIRDQTRKLQEVRAMGMACRGPHVVQLHHTWAEGVPATMYILMELCPGGSLHTRARSRPPPNETESRDILGQMTLALYACHSQHIAHSDVKLENVYYDLTGRLKLGDFGLAAFLDAKTGSPVSYRAYETTNNHQHACYLSRENTDTCWSQDDGDARYISLDMLNDRQCFKAGDVFSLGMCMFELMSGKPLPRGGQEHTNLRCTDAAAQALLLTRRYSHELIQVVVDMIAQEPKSRPTVEQLLFHPMLCGGGNNHTEGAPPTLVSLSHQQTMAECEFYRLEISRASFANGERF